MIRPIAEQAYVGAAVGAAMTGLRPIVELMFSDFMCVCFDELVNEAAKLRFMFGGKVKVPLVMRRLPVREQVRRHSTRRVLKPVLPISRDLRSLFRQRHMMPKAY